MLIQKTELLDYFEDKIEVVFSPKNISKAGKIQRKLSKLSIEELLRPFTI